MTLTIKGISKDTYIKLTHGLDLYAGEGERKIVTSKEVVNYPDESETVLYSVHIHNSNEYTLKLENDGLYICRAGVVPSFFLSNNDFDKIFVI